MVSGSSLGGPLTTFIMRASCVSTTLDYVNLLFYCHGDSIYCDSNILYYFNPKLSPRVHSFSFPIFVIFECNYSYISVYLAIDQSGF